jgi:hypothetical protein
MRIAGFVLLAMLISACTSVSPPPTNSPSGVTPSPVIIYVTPAPTTAPSPTLVLTPAPVPTQPPTPRPTATPLPTINPADYTQYSSREWSRFLKSPWDGAFEQHIVWACITQFDGATGPDEFRGQASYRNEDYWYSDGENSYFESNPISNPGMLDDFFADDVVRMYVVTAGDYSYETTMGGTLTVPLFSIVGIEHHGSC